jgi:hypothetical protein
MDDGLQWGQGFSGVILGIRDCIRGVKLLGYVELPC